MTGVSDLVEGERRGRKAHDVYYCWNGCMYDWIRVPWVNFGVFDACAGISVGGGCGGGYFWVLVRLGSKRKNEKVLWVEYN